MNGSNTGPCILFQIVVGVPVQISPVLGTVGEFSHRGLRTGGKMAPGVGSRWFLGDAIISHKYYQKVLFQSVLNSCGNHTLGLEGSKYINDTYLGDRSVKWELLRVIWSSRDIVAIRSVSVRKHEVLCISQSAWRLDALANLPSQTRV